MKNGGMSPNYFPLGILQTFQMGMTDQYRDQDMKK